MNIDFVETGMILQLKKRQEVTIQNANDKLDTQRCYRLRVVVKEVNRSSIRCAVTGMSPVNSTIKETLIRSKLLDRFEEYYPTDRIPTVSIKKTSLSYEDVVANVTSNQLLECVESHSMLKADITKEGGVVRIHYLEGQVLPRKEIKLDTGKWKLYFPVEV